MISDAEDQQSLPLLETAIPDADSEVFILAIIDVNRRRWCSPIFVTPSPRINLIPLLTMPSSGPEMPDNVRAVLPSSSGADLISLAGRKLTSDFGHAYRDLVKRAAIAGLQRVPDEAALARASIIGAVSTYNPFHGGKEKGSPQIASAELYDPLAWRQR